MGSAGPVNRKNKVFQLLSAASGYRQQIGVIFVAAALGLVIVLNVAMAPSTNVERAQAQLTYLKSEPTQVRPVVQ